MCGNKIQTGFVSKNLIVGLFRLRQPTGLMQREGFGQQ
jgi:hypothetical protein